MGLKLALGLIQMFCLWLKILEAIVVPQSPCLLLCLLWWPVGQPGLSHDFWCIKPLVFLKFPLGGGPLGGLSRWMLIVSETRRLSSQSILSLSAESRQQLPNFVQFPPPPHPPPIGLTCSITMRNLGSCLLLLVYRRHQLLLPFKAFLSLVEGH